MWELGGMCKNGIGAWYRSAYAIRIRCLQAQAIHKMGLRDWRRTAPSICMTAWDKEYKAWSRNQHPSCRAPAPPLNGRLKTLKKPTDTKRAALPRKRQCDIQSLLFDLKILSTHKGEPPPVFLCRLWKKWDKGQKRSIFQVETGADNGRHCFSQKNHIFRYLSKFLNIIKYFSLYWHMMKNMIISYHIKEGVL